MTGPGSTAVDGAGSSGVLGVAARVGLLGPRAQQLDRAAFAWVAARPSPVLDAVLPRLSRSANHGVLWAATALALAIPDSPRLRRAAMRGTLALSLASPVANVLGKGLVRRRRPVLDLVPSTRLARRQPHTSSFPSGHSASAAAFAVGVGIDCPAAAVPVGLLAAAVAYSRVHIGVHYPGDVAAGLLLGAATAAATTRVLPRRPRVAARAEPAHVDLPLAPEGAGLVLVANPRSGGRGTEQIAEVRAAFPGARVVDLGEDDDVPAVMAAAAANATALGVAGGDGTVQCAATAAAAAGVPLAVLPAGTLNHFAADLGITSAADTIRALHEGSAVRVDLGRVDGKDAGFLNTASIGGYPEMVATRESLEHRLGKWPTMLVALVRVLVGEPPIDVTVDGERRRLWLLFAGAGAYSPSGFAPTWRERLDSGLLDLRLVDATRPGARLRLVLAVALGRLGRSTVYEARTARSVTVQYVGSGEPPRLARDGEVEPLGRPRFTLSSDAGALVVYRPRGAARP